MKSYLSVLKNYMKFHGRTRRKKYWLFMLFNLIFIMETIISENLVESINGLNQVPFFWIYILITFIPLLAVSVRRLHDIGESGWMLFIVLIPIVGPIWLLLLLIKKSNRGRNRYGENTRRGYTYYNYNKLLL